MKINQSSGIHNAKQIEENDREQEELVRAQRTHRHRQSHDSQQLNIGKYNVINAIFFAFHWSSLRFTARCLLIRQIYIQIYTYKLRQTNYTDTHTRTHQLHCHKKFANIFEWQLWIYTHSSFLQPSISQIGSEYSRTIDSNAFCCTHSQYNKKIFQNLFHYIFHSLIVIAVVVVRVRCRENY